MAYGHVLRVAGRNFGDRVRLGPFHTFGFYASRLYAFVAVFFGSAYTTFRNDDALFEPRLFYIEAAQQQRGKTDCHGRNGGFHRSRGQPANWCNEL